MQDYNKITKQIDSLGGIILGYVGDFRRFPLYKIKQGQGKKVLLSAGVHGDEPAGVYSILEFLEHHISQYEKDFEFTIFPCVNPIGFQHNTRKNKTLLNLCKKNINREFKKRKSFFGVKEIKLILSQLEQYLFTMDLHEIEESWESDFEPCTPGQFYLWETCANKSKRIGQKILEKIETDNIPICKWPIIDKEKNNGGVIWYPENRTNPEYADETSFDAYLAKHHTQHSFTIETPKRLHLEKRIQANIISITTALENIK